MGSKNGKPTSTQKLSIASAVDILEKNNNNTNNHHPIQKRHASLKIEKPNAKQKNLEIQLSEASDDVFDKAVASPKVAAKKVDKDMPEIKHLNTLETSLISEGSDVGSQFLNDIELVNFPISPAPPTPPKQAKPLVPILSNVPHDYSSTVKPFMPSIRMKTFIKSGSKSVSDVIFDNPTEPMAAVTTTTTTTATLQKVAPRNPKGVRFSEHVLIIDNRDHAGHHHGSPKFKKDIMRMIYERKATGSKALHRRFSNSTGTTTNDSNLSSSPVAETKSWNVSFFGSSNVKKVN